MISTVDATDVHDRVYAVCADREEFARCEPVSCLAVDNYIEKLVFGLERYAPDAFLKVFFIVDTPKGTQSLGTRISDSNKI